MKIKISQSDKALISAYRLLQDKEVFSAEDLAVKSWQEFPEDFCLAGYKNHPNSNKVYTFVMGQNAALIKNGYIKKIGEKQYKISSTGISHVENNLNQGEKDNKKFKINLGRQETNKLKEFLENKITKTILQNNNIDDLDFDDVSRFWKISNSVTYPDLIEKISQVDTWLKQLKEEMKKEKRKNIIIGDRNGINDKQLKLLIESQEVFKNKFKTEINYIKEQRPKPVRN